MNSNYIKIVIISIFTSILLTGFRFPNNKIYNIDSYNESISENIEYEEQNDNIKIDNIDIVKPFNKIEITENNINNEINNEINIDKAEEISEVTEEKNEETIESEFTFFKDAKIEIDNYAKSGNLELLKSKGKYYIITAIDFIFYDKPINGVYFKDLTDDAKLIIIKDIEIIDNLIMKQFPNYKDAIGSKYLLVADFLSTKYLNVLDSIRNYLGDENYDAITRIKNQIFGDIKEGANKITTFVKDKYENWRNN